jgi:hypothetical protein
VLILLSADRWRRVWIFLIPALLYAAWFLWSRDSGASSESHITLSNLLLAPAWAFNSLATVGAALLGLDYNFLRDEANRSPVDTTAWGPVLAAIALAALGSTLWLRGFSKWLLAMLAVPATLWVIEAGAALPDIRTPQSTRYIFPGTIAVLLAAVEAARGVQLGRKGILVLYGLVAISLATNVALLREASAVLRQSRALERSDLAAVEIGNGRLGALKNGLLAAALRSTGRDGLATGYLEAVRKFGSPAYSVPQLRAQSEPVRQRADAALGGNLTLQPSSPQGRRCRQIVTKPGQPISFRVPRKGAVLRTSGTSANLTLRRFATEFTVQPGRLTADRPMLLTIPPDSAPDPWYASTQDSELEVCTAHDKPARANSQRRRAEGRR